MAQFNPGAMRRDGQGMPQNFKEALWWYAKAEKQGHAMAQNNTGIAR